MIKLKDIDFKIISELMKNSKISDRKLSKVVGVSQPTVSRKRAWLEKEELLVFTAIPDLVKLGFELMAFKFYSWTPEATLERCQNGGKIMKKLSTYLSQHPNIIFASKGQGFGMQKMMISLHENYTNYVKLMNNVHEEWGMYLHESKSFIVSLKEDVTGRQLTFKSLVEYIYKNR